MTRTSFVRAASFRAQKDRSTVFVVRWRLALKWL